MEKPKRSPFRSVSLVMWGCGWLLVLWIAVAYFALPDWLRHRAGEHPALANAPVVTTTPTGTPGDPLNLFLVATEEELVRAMLKSGWYPADPVTFGSSLRIAADAVLRRPYDDAPVSTLLLSGKHQDLALEKPTGHDPRQRHHVRFWKAAGGETAWWGAATFDTSVGFSHATGEITHHIAADVDRERELVLSDLIRGGFASTGYKPDFQKREGRNGGGDPWRSDGKLGLARSLGGQAR